VYLDVVIGWLGLESQPHEMVSIYTVDGPDLVMTHYCVLGNKPRMKADLKAPPNQICLQFAGGNNLDPQKDKHMHAATLTIVDDDHPRQMRASEDACSTTSHLLPVKSHNLIVSSWPAEASVLPSRLNATTKTGPRCPCSLAVSFLPATSQSRTEPSMLHEARVMPSGLNATCTTDLF